MSLVPHKHLNTLTHKHKTMKLSLGFSPCPNDTFIFDALVHHKIDTEGLDFKVVMSDVEELNRRAFAQDLDVTKLSYHAFAYVTEFYNLLDAGSALGNNCGPLLIARCPMSEEEIVRSKIAIPGKYTTANFLLGVAYPAAKEKVETLFSQIEGAIVNEQVNAGVIIHENRFTYQEKGLVKLMDLGEYWETTTGLPIPLGGIVVKKSLPLNIQQKVNRVMRRSVQFAFDHPQASLDFVKAHAQEMNEAVMRQHIDLYVNDYTLDLGEKGRAAVACLLEKAEEQAGFELPRT